MKRTCKKKIEIPIHFQRISVRRIIQIHGACVKKYSCYRQLKTTKKRFKKNNMFKRIYYIQYILYSALYIYIH